MSYRYYTCDVFTERLFGGNPLAVLPEADGLSGGQIQQIANFSESAFVFTAKTHKRVTSECFSWQKDPVCRSSERGDRVRISGYELWKIGNNGLIAESKGHFDGAEYELQLKLGVDE